MTTDNRITYETDGYICLIGFNRADKRNAFDSHMIKQLSDALTNYENDDNLRCALIFAHGEHFTAGLDLMELQDKVAKGVFVFDETQIDPWGVGGKLRAKPVVVAIQGTAMWSSSVITVTLHKWKSSAVSCRLVAQRYALSRRLVGKKRCRICLQAKTSTRKLLIGWA